MQSPTRNPHSQAQDSDERTTNDDDDDDDDDEMQVGLYELYEKSGLYPGTKKLF